MLTRDAGTFCNEINPNWWLHAQCAGLLDCFQGRLPNERLREDWFSFHFQWQPQAHACSCHGNSNTEPCSYFQSLSLVEMWVRSTRFLVQCSYCHYSSVQSAVKFRECAGCCLLVLNVQWCMSSITVNWRTMRAYMVPTVHRLAYVLKPDGDDLDLTFDGLHAAAEANCVLLTVQQTELRFALSWRHSPISLLRLLEQHVRMSQATCMRRCIPVK